jgi:hypothetical protein
VSLTVQALWSAGAIAAVVLVVLVLSWTDSRRYK